VAPHYDGQARRFSRTSQDVITSARKSAAIDGNFHVNKSDIGLYPSSQYKSYMSHSGAPVTSE
jgi:hypothetical protein